MFKANSAAGIRFSRQHAKDAKDQVILGRRQTSWWIAGQSSILPFQLHRFCLHQQLFLEESSNSELAVISHIWKHSALLLPAPPTLCGWEPQLGRGVHIHHTSRTVTVLYTFHWDNVDFGGGFLAVPHLHYIHSQSCTNAFNIFIQYSVFLVIVGVQQWPS